MKRGRYSAECLLEVLSEQIACDGCVVDTNQISSTYNPIYRKQPRMVNATADHITIIGGRNVK
jgi:hypothetical protein